MTREEKTVVIEELKEKFSSTANFYVCDASGMSVAQTNNFRRLCYERGIEYKVYKNTLIKKALESSQADYSEFGSVLKGPGQAAAGVQEKRESETRAQGRFHRHVALHRSRPTRSPKQNQEQRRTRR